VLQLLAYLAAVSAVVAPLTHVVWVAALPTQSVAVTRTVHPQWGARSGADHTTVHSGRDSADPCVGINGGRRDGAWAWAWAWAWA
jgi:hypothetical protein